MGCWLVMQNQHSPQSLGQIALFTVRLVSAVQI